MTTSSTGTPVYLRDVVDVARAYQNPPQYLNFYTWRDANGAWQRSRAITLAVQMHAGQQINRGLVIIGSGCLEKGFQAGAEV
jgi:hypothetical protein